MHTHLTRRSALKLSLAGGAFSNMATFVRPAAADEHAARHWWKEAVVYQIFPRSFADSNGDGIGDLRGIISKADYLKNLGVNVVWLSPHYDTPNIDSGYDIRDYRKVNPDFGTMEDFEQLVAVLRKHGIKLVVDLVSNHTSDQHVWFQQSRKSRDNRYRDYYIWRDGREDGAPPNNYPSFFGGKAWQKDDATGQYYLHYFAKQQPDLNWENPKVRHEIYDIMRFWLARGVAGFRMDVIPFISKPEGLRDLTPQELDHPEFTYANGPHLHQFIQEMNREVLARHDYLTVGEAFGVPFDKTPLLVSEKRHELGMVFHFDIVRIGREDWRLTPWSIPDLKAVIAREDRCCGPDGWLTTFFENHDNPRSVSYFGDGSEAAAKALALVLFSRRGTPFLFQGQEIGMTNISFQSLDDFEDVNAKGIWADNVPTNRTPASKVLHDLSMTSRDNARTPMQWNAESKAGFTTGTPWFRVNPNTSRINVAAQENNPDSVLAFYRTLISLRSSHPNLIYGTFTDTDPHHPHICAFLRKGEQQSYLALVNLSAETQACHPHPDLKPADILIDTHQTPLPAAFPSHLHPWQGILYLLKS